MKNILPDDLKKALAESIDIVLQNKQDYLVNAEKDFSRTQKISLHDTILFPMIASNESTPVEMLDYFPETALPSQAALSYRRDQIKPEAYKAVLDDFTAKIPQIKTYHGIYVIACDGSRINTPYNPKDLDSFVHCIKGRKGFNQYHLITCYDILNNVFTDAVIQGYFSMNEKLAFCEMMDRNSNNSNCLYVADRGFSSYNVIAHAVNNGSFFLIRLTEPMAQNIFFDTQDISNTDVLDVEDTFYIGRVRNKESKCLKNYHFKGKAKTYDFIPAGSKKIDSFQVRLVKFQLTGGGSEYLVTNLPKDSFTLEDLKELYRLRWGIETSYRYLKYASGLVHMHAIKPSFIFQEIYAKLTLYNFCSGIMNCTRTKSNSSLKHKYNIEKTYLIKSCIRYLKGILNDILNIVKKRKVPERAGRRFKRNIRCQHADTMQYR